MLVGDRFGSLLALAADPAFMFAFLIGMSYLLIAGRADMLLAVRMQAGDFFRASFTNRTNANFLVICQLLITVPADMFACPRMLAGNYPGFFTA